MTKMTLDKLFSETFMSELLTVEDKNPPYDISGADGEEVLGTMSQLERKLWSLAKKYGKISGALKVQAKFDAATEQEKSRLYNASNDADYQSAAILELFWALIRERLQVTPGFAIGARTGFTIVQFRKREYF